MRRFGDAGRHRFARAENLGMHAVVGRAPSGKAGRDIVQERSGTAQIKMSIAGHAKFVEGFNGNVAGGIVVIVCFVWLTYSSVALKRPYLQSKVQ
jgi:hypothetical protein